MTDKERDWRRLHIWYVSKREKVRGKRGKGTWQKGRSNVENGICAIQKARKRDERRVKSLYTAMYSYYTRPCKAIVHGHVKPLYMAM